MEPNPPPPPPIPQPISPQVSYQPVDQTEEHIRLLTVFHYVLAGLLFVCSFLPIFHLGMGIFFLVGDFSPEFSGDVNGDGVDEVISGGEQMPKEMQRFMGLMFTIFPALFMLGLATLAVFTLVAGRKLAKRESHTFCMVIAGILCAFAPLGTVLGIFTIIVLMRPQARVLFGLEPSPSSSIE